MIEIAIAAFGVTLALVGIVALWVRTLARRVALLESAVSGLASLGGDDRP